MAGLDTDGLEALSYFQRFLPRAYAFQAPLAFAASASALAHFVAGATDTYITAPSGRFTVDSADSRVGWLMCGLLMGAQLPYSFKVLMPLNRQLLLHDAQKQPREWKSAKISLWGHLHHARTAASIAALGVVLYQVFGTRNSGD